MAFFVLQVKLFFILISLNKIEVGNPVFNKLNLIGLDIIDFGQELDRTMTHYHHFLSLITDFMG